MALFPWRKKARETEARERQEREEQERLQRDADRALTERSDDGDGRGVPLSDEAADIDETLADPTAPIEPETGDEDEYPELTLEEPDEIRPLQGELRVFDEDEPPATLESVPSEFAVEAPPPVAEVSEPVHEAPELVDEAPEPVHEAPELVDEAPEPVDEAPELVVEPEVVVEAPAPIEEPEVVVEAPAPIEEPEVVVEAPAPIEEPELVVEAPAPTAEKPEPVVEAPEPVNEIPELVAEEPAPAVEEPGGLFSRLKKGLGKSRAGLAANIGNLILGEKEISDDALEDLETALLVADVGVDATRRIIDELTPQVKRRELANTDSLFGALGRALTETLEPSAKQLVIDANQKPFVILVVGVNGAGKTTTIGKLASRFKAEGRSVLMAAGDTFRAAAVEQLQTWGERNDVPVIAQAKGADSASVIFDAMEAARARNIDVVLADTAGRLQNKQGLMDELAKIGRIMGRFEPDAPHEVLLVLDGGTGQNALSQVREFSAAVDVTGLVITKLDGSAKGGIVFAVSEASGLPIYFIGVGEQIDDLRPFEPTEFVAALLARDDE